MSVWQKYIKELRALCALLKESEANLEMLKSDKSKACKRFEDTIISAKEGLENTLKELVTYPPHHARHHDKLQTFHGEATYDKCIFIMTKYCDGKNKKKDEKLERVINAVCDSIKKHGYTPKLAREYNCHPAVWDNTEIGLLGSARGLAIVEDKYKPELNPNIA